MSKYNLIINPTEEELEIIFSKGYISNNMYISITEQNRNNETYHFTETGVGGNEIVLLKTETDQLYVFCPHCNITISVEALNCCIFRCGVYKHNGEQIQPHMPKDECDGLVSMKTIYGCGKPFKIEKWDNVIYCIFDCGYI